MHMHTSIILQGLMYGYATDETKEMIPLSHSLSHQLLKCAADGGNSVYIRMSAR